MENKRETEAFAASQAGFAHPRRTARPTGLPARTDRHHRLSGCPGKKNGTSASTANRQIVRETVSESRSLPRMSAPVGHNPSVSIKPSPQSSINHRSRRATTLAPARLPTSQKGREPVNRSVVAKRSISSHTSYFFDRRFQVRVSGHGLLRAPIFPSSEVLSG